MDRDLLIRLALCSVLVVIVLVTASTRFYVNIVAPLCVVAVAVVMFWPRRATGNDPEVDSTDRVPGA